MEKIKTIVYFIRTFRMNNYLAIVACVIGVTLGAWVDSMLQPVVYVAAEEPKPAPKVVLIEVRKTVPQELLDIADCESGIRNKDGSAVKGSSRHFLDDGSVMLGAHTPEEYGQDVGRWQINTLHHGERAKALGLDLYNEYHNEKYAMMLWEEQGAAPWEASRGCHGYK